MPLSAIPQVIITITIDGDNSRPVISYSYIDPFSGTVFNKASSCVLPQIVPAYCLFALDYASSGHGWVITGATATNGTGQLDSPITKNGLALITTLTDPFIHTFTIDFINTVTGDKASDDPQEGNIPVPKKVNV
jgi:hypothetical protein